MSAAPVRTAIQARSRDLDGKMTVRRVLPYVRQRAVGPFVFLDQMGPQPFAPGEGLDIPPHPHIGLATATYLFDGAITHRDSLGYDQVIRPGDVNWMTAGRGIVHSERTEPSARAAGGSLFGVQAWVALPRALEECEPRFDHHPQGTLPTIERDGLRIRVLAGALEGEASPVRFDDIVYLDVRAPADAAVDLPRAYPEVAIYVASGALDLDGQRLGVGDLGVLGEGDRIVARALTATRLLVLGGAPLDGPRHMFWNFVSSRRERLETAKEDWRRDRLGTVPGETDRVPLPG